MLHRKGLNRRLDRGETCFRHCNISCLPMSPMGQKPTSAAGQATPVLPPEADITADMIHVCFVPKAVVSRCSKDKPKGASGAPLVGLLLCSNGERDEKRRSLPNLGFQPNLASVHLNDALGDRKPQTGAALLFC